MGSTHLINTQRNSSSGFDELCRNSSLHSITIKWRKMEGEFIRNSLVLRLTTVYIDPTPTPYSYRHPVAKNTNNLQLYCMQHTPSHRHERRDRRECRRVIVIMTLSDLHRVTQTFSFNQRCQTKFIISICASSHVLTSIPQGTRHQIMKR